MEELKPCPFCGGKPTLEASEDDLKHHAVYVCCYNCGSIGGSADGEIEETLEAYIRYAVDAWNRRVNE